MGEAEGRLNYKSAIKIGLSFLLLFAVSYFFFRKFQMNWELIQSFDYNIDVFYILLSFIAIVTTYLLTTYAWFISVNTLSQSHITFINSIAIVNTSNFTKYIPGKIWSYALQLYWLEGSGFSKSLILYVNLVNLGVSLITALILGLCYVAFIPAIFPLTVTIPLLILLVVFDVLFVLFSFDIINKLVLVFNRIFKMEVKYFKTSIKLLAYLHIIYVVAGFCFGMAAFFLCDGIGFGVLMKNMFAVMSSMMISEVAGVVSFIAPGGLGVREGMMYILLKDVSSGALPLVLPLAMRLVSMVVDIVLGTTAFILLKGITVVKK